MQDKRSKTRRFDPQTPSMLISDWSTPSVTGVMAWLRSGQADIGKSVPEVCGPAKALPMGNDSVADMSNALDSGKNACACAGTAVVAEESDWGVVPNMPSGSDTGVVEDAGVGSLEVAPSDMDNSIVSP